MATEVITLKGLNQVQRFMLNALPRIKQELKNINDETGHDMQADAQANAPVDTAALKQSIRFEVINGGLGVVLTVDVPYWAYVEFGTGGLVVVPPGFEELASQYKGKGVRTVNRAAHPFMIPAWLKYRDEYLKRIKQRLPRLLR